MLAGLVAGIMFNKSDAKFPADEVNHETITICNENLILYVNNGNISNVYLFEDRLCLLDPDQGVKYSVLASVNGSFPTKIIYTFVHSSYCY